jgi:hypothetical protein
MGWGKISCICSLKIIALACFLTPAATVLPVTPAYAQFQIIIPGFGYGYRGRRYGRHHSRRARRGKNSNDNAGEITPAEPTTGPATGRVAPGGGTGVAGGGSGGKKVRGTAD